MSSIVVSDAGPLNYLILIDCVDTLADLFDHVLVPLAVRKELLNESAPTKVKQWMASPKHWLRFEQVFNPQPISGLHAGETEALQLALSAKADGVLIDDMDGRIAARKLGLVVIGTIGLLERAAEKGLIELPTAIAKIRQTTMFVSEDLLNAALDRNVQRLEKMRRERERMKQP